MNYASHRSAITANLYLTHVYILQSGDHNELSLDLLGKLLFAAALLVLLVFVVPRLVTSYLHEKNGCADNEDSVFEKLQDIESLSHSNCNLHDYRRLNDGLDDVYR